MEETIVGTSNTAGVNPFLEDDDDDDLFLTPVVKNDNPVLPSLDVDEGFGYSDLPLPEVEIPFPYVDEISDVSEDFESVDSYGSDDAFEPSYDSNDSGVFDYSDDDFVSSDPLPLDEPYLDEPYFDLEEDPNAPSIPYNKDTYIEPPYVPPMIVGEHDFVGATLDLDAIISQGIYRGASDIYIRPGDKIIYKVLGDVIRTETFGEIDGDQTDYLEKEILLHTLQDEFVQNMELDSSYIVRSGRYKGRRLRLNLDRADEMSTFTFRIITDKVPSPDELGIPVPMRDWVNRTSGLILVNGPTGSGKSTTLSSLIQQVLWTRSINVLTLEKPVEYRYPIDGLTKAAIKQREIGRDARGFPEGITAAMRQSPDIILVGEVRNRSEVDPLLEAANSGHLTISTMHVNSCPVTLERIRSMFSAEEQSRILSILSTVLRGMMTQCLVKTPDGRGRVAIYEVLEVDKEVRDLLALGDARGLREYMERKETTMEHELVRAAKVGKITWEAAENVAPDPSYFRSISGM